MSGVIDFITGKSAGKQADAAEAGAEIAREQAGMGREQWQEYKKNLYPEELRFIQQTMAGRGLDAESTAGLARIDELARRDPSIAAGLNELSGMADSPVSARDFLDASRENIDYWNTDPNVLRYESQRAAEAAQQESDAEQRDVMNRMAAYGINPASGRFAGTLRRASLGAAANRISAINRAIEGARGAEYGRKVDAYGRRLQGMGLANEAAQGNFARRAGILDTRRAMGMDDFNKGLQAFSTREGAKLTDFNKRMGAVGLGKGIGTQGIQLLGQGQVGMQNTAGIYGSMADRANQMASDLIGAAVGGYGYSQIGKKAGV